MTAAERRERSTYASVQAAYDYVDPYRTQTIAYYREETIHAFVEPFLKNNPYLIIQLFFDGVAAAGKGTILDFLKSLGIEIETTSTGTFARAITKFAIDKGYTTWKTDRQKQQRCLQFQRKLKNGVTITLEKSEQGEVIVVTEVTKRAGSKIHQVKEHRYTAADLSDSEVTSQISYVAGLDFVCQLLDETLINLVAEFNNIAIDGRDNWARISRNKEAIQQRLDVHAVQQFYFYVYAGLMDRQERAVERRKKHLLQSGKQISEAEIEADLDKVRNKVAERDEGDMSRTNGSLLRPEVAEQSQIYDWYFDTTLLSPDEMNVYFLAKLYALIMPQAGGAVFTALTEYFKHRENARLQLLELDVLAHLAYYEEVKDQQQPQPTSSWSTIFSASPQIDVAAT